MHVCICHVIDNMIFVKLIKSLYFWEKIQSLYQNQRYFHKNTRIISKKNDKDNKGHYKIVTYLTILISNTVIKKLSITATLT